MKAYNTPNNRRLQYRLFDSAPARWTLPRTVTYFHYEDGDVANITAKGEEPTNYTTTDAREFSWDSPRARLTTLDFDKGQSTSNDPGDWTIESTHRTDHIGNSPYRDLAAAGVGTPTEYMQYLGTAARQPVSSGVPTDLEFLHGDLIGSTMTVSDDNGTPKEFPANSGVASVAYTAFGEVLTSTGAPGGDSPENFTRYQYAGKHGYESDVLALEGVNPALPPASLQHVGYRWYQPEIGRFVQRDPIGLDGGMNVYAYCDNDPLTNLDPSGLGFWQWCKEVGKQAGDIAIGVCNWLTGKSAPAGVGTVAPIANSMKAAPDITRIGIAEKVKAKCFDRPTGTINEQLDYWDNDHGICVKPRRRLD